MAASFQAPAFSRLLKDPGFPSRLTASLAFVYDFRIGTPFGKCQIKFTIH